MCRNRIPHSTYVWNPSKILKRWKFGEKIRISLLNKKWVFLQNWLCPRKFSIWVNFDGSVVLSGHPSVIGWRPLTRSWFRFWFWWQFNGDFFDRLVSLFFFAQFDSRFYFCIFWIFRLFLIFWIQQFWSVDDCGKVEGPEKSLFDSVWLMAVHFRLGRFFFENFSNLLNL